MGRLPSCALCDLPPRIPLAGEGNDVYKVGIYLLCYLQTGLGNLGTPGSPSNTDDIDGPCCFLPGAFAVAHFLGVWLFTSGHTSPWCAKNSIRQTPGSNSHLAYCYACDVTKEEGYFPSVLLRRGRPPLCASFIPSHAIVARSNTDLGTPIWRAPLSVLERSRDEVRFCDYQKHLPRMMFLRSPFYPRGVLHFRPRPALLGLGSKPERSLILR